MDSLIGYIAIDIERTGKYLAGVFPKHPPTISSQEEEVPKRQRTTSAETIRRDDKTFAIGWAAGDKMRQNFISGHVCLNLHLGSDYTPSVIRQKWEAADFEMRCFDDFWCKHLDILQKLQDPTQVILVETESEMAFALNQALARVEARYDRIGILSDTLSFDTTWCNMLLLQHGFEPLSSTRNGKGYVSGYEVDSYVMGCLGLTPDTPWTTYSTEFDQTIGKVFPELEGIHDHHPENDAKSILVKYIRALNY